MSLILGCAALLCVQGEISPNRLPIGTPGTLHVALGSMVSTATGAPATADTVAVAADGHRFVYLGESHDQLAHHQMQASIIEALARRGRSVVVGFEMFTRPVQGSLNPWTLGWWTRDEFIEKSQWKTEWGFDFALYEPIFNVVRANRLPMIALNVPRDWVRAVGRGGLEALTPEQKAAVPPVDTTDRVHRQIFEAMMGGHPMTGAQGENIYASMVLWDVGMADSALKALASMPPDSKRVFVVVAGSGHVMYKRGINYRVKGRTGEEGITVVMTSGDAPEEVSRGLADYVYNSAVVKNPDKMPK